GSEDPRSTRHGPRRSGDRGSDAEAGGAEHDHGDQPQQAASRRAREAAGPGGQGRGNGRRIRRGCIEKETTAMPKMKTHRAAATRFRVTRKGKVLHRKATGNHMLTKKTGSRRRRIEGMAEVGATKEQKRLKRLLAR